MIGGSGRQCLVARMGRRLQGADRERGWIPGVTLRFTPGYLRAALSEPILAPGGILERFRFNLTHPGGLSGRS